MEKVAMQTEAAEIGFLLPVLFVNAEEDSRDFSIILPRLFSVLFCRYSTNASHCKSQIC